MVACRADWPAVVCMAARTEHHMYVTTQQRADAIIFKVYFESEIFASVRPYRWTRRTMYAGSAPMYSAPRHARLKRVSGTWICRTHFISETIYQAGQKQKDAWEKRRRDRSARSIVGTRVNKPREVRRLGDTSEAGKCL